MAAVNCNNSEFWEQPASTGGTHAVGLCDKRNRARSRTCRFPTGVSLCGADAVLFAISSLLGYVLSILMIHISQKIVFNMRKDVFNKLMELPVSFSINIRLGISSAESHMILIR